MHPHVIKLLTVGQLAGLVAATPATGPAAEGYSKRSPLGISLPPLIPSIPGVTVPLVDAAPPLPILQIPTPPLDSPPFEVTEIRPKKIGYFWTGAGDNHHKDFLATVSLDDVSGNITIYLFCTPDLHALLGHLWYHHPPLRRSQQRKQSSPFGHFLGWQDSCWWWLAVSAEDSGHCLLLGHE